MRTRTDPHRLQCLLPVYRCRRAWTIRALPLTRLVLPLALLVLVFLQNPVAMAESTTGPSPSPSASTSTVTHLTADAGNVALALVVVLMLVTGLVLVVGRLLLEGSAASRAQSSSRDSEKSTTSFVRSWLALALVGGLLIFIAVSFWLDDPTLRNTLIGGLVASVAAAVAYYFSAKSSDQARRDLLSAVLPSATVPDLLNKNLAEVHKAFASSPLRVETDPQTPADGAQVASQMPAGGLSAPSGSTVVATFGPVPGSQRNEGG